MMKKLLITLAIVLLLVSVSFAGGTIQCDSDSNDAMDISCGGTNAVSASAARTNLAVPGLATDNTYTGENDFSGGTALIPSGSSLPGTCSAGEMFNLTSATSGQRFYICETTNSWVLQGDGSGSSTFLGLSDTPSVSDYTGHAGDYLRVNSTPDGLEFVTPSATPWMEPITKDSPTASTYRWFKADATLTVTGFDVIEAAADTGTITVDVYECSSTGTGCASILSAPVTATATGAAATITDTSIASGAWVEIVYGTPSGTVSQVAATLKGTR